MPAFLFMISFKSIHFFVEKVSLQMRSFPTVAFETLAWFSLMTWALAER